jgi:hypothetical protein
MEKNKREIRPKFRWEIFFKMAQQDADLGELCSELIDNPIPKGDDESVDITLEIVKGARAEESYIKITDNGIGISRDILPEIFEVGESPMKEKLLMSEMGIGLKLALFGLGKPEYIATKQNCLPSNSLDGGCYEYICKPHFHSGIPFSKNDLVQFNVDINQTPEITTDSGTVIKINDCDEQVPNWTEVQFKRFVAKFNATYLSFLGNRLNLNVVYTNNKRKTTKTYSQKCEAYSPVLTNPHKIISEFVDFGLGENELVIDNKYVPIEGYPDIKVILCAGYKAHPNQLKQAFTLTKKEMYNVDNNTLSPYSYFSKERGIILKKRGKVLNFGSNLEVASSRENAHYITLEVEGIPSTGLKKELKKGNRREAMLEAVKKELEKEGFYLRNAANFGARSEKEDQEKFVKHLLGDGAMCKKYGITNPQQVETFVRNEVGECDIVVWDNNKDNVIAVGEVKKDRPNADTSRQLFGYMAYYRNGNPNNQMPRGFVVCQNKQQTTFTKQVDSFKSLVSGLEIDYYNSNTFYIS